MFGGIMQNKCLVCGSDQAIYIATIGGSDFKYCNKCIDFVSNKSSIRVNPDYSSN